MTLEPDDPAACRSYCYALYLNGEYRLCRDEAIELLWDIDDDGLRLIAASACFELRDYATAADLYYRVSRGDESMTDEDYRNYAVCLARQGRYDEAESIITRLERRGEDAAVTNYLRGDLYYAQGLLDDAIDCFLDAMDAAESGALRSRICLSLAEAYYAAGDYDSVISLAEAVLLDEGENAASPWYELLGQAYYGRAEQSGSAQDYHSAAEAFLSMPDTGRKSAELYQNIFICYYMANEFNLARRVAEEMSEAYPADYTPHALLGILCVQENNGLDEAERDYSEAVSEYETACSLVTKDDDRAQLTRLESLIGQLRAGGWIES